MKKARLRWVECCDCGQPVQVKRGLIAKHGDCPARAPTLDDAATEAPRRDIIAELRSREDVWAGTDGDRDDLWA